MADRCEVCPALRAENGMLRRHINDLNDRIGQLVGGITSTVALIQRETDKPTMPRQQLIPAINERLIDLLRR